MHSNPAFAAELAARDLSISDCRDAIRELQLRLESLERHSANKNHNAAHGELQIAMDAVLAATKQLFPREVTIQKSSDPEIPDEEYFVFRALATGTVDEIVAKYDEWHRRLPQLAPGNEAMFRLSIDAKA